jgi:nicotinamide-nucleotide amidase
MDEVRRTLAPVESAVRTRLGNFIVAEDDATLESVVLAALQAQGATLAIVETFSSGQIAGRIGHLRGAEAILRRGIVARRREDICGAVGLGPGALNGGTSKEAAGMVACAALVQTGATHALAVLVDVDDGADRIEFAGTICLAIATANETVTRRSRITGGRDWVRLGAAEMGLDCLRRYLQGLPVDERIDFEKVE